MTVLLICRRGFIRGRSVCCRVGADGCFFEFERGASEAGDEIKTWPDYCATCRTKQPLRSTNRLLSFLSFLTLQRFKHFIIFFFLLNSLTRLQPEGFFFLKSRTTCMCKICRRWNNWLKGREVKCFFKKKKKDDFFFFFFKGEWMEWIAERSPSLKPCLMFHSAKAFFVVCQSKSILSRIRHQKLMQEDRSTT